MSHERDAEAVPEVPMFSSTLHAERAAGRGRRPVTLYQEINERRARNENAELLRNLRSL